ncbi:MAG TPA: Asp-tRNA(Asn)/Glu-tRNA(Gln) amidotransferase subunit GatA [Blastocatellia bacterium]|nr:Asp-tRNA(Asn)/Glu-tRNA(Gln) amidotransferase subunit GatA [Blastocatellia bacterium]HMV83713.1 Asp-tRNA(Asn)/Glu-tRNA(Gln) amidotransferase subunit GatA [Blastocatellia bacterium]HMX28659.1 Asp-tRNA(Asn)/Glu-tRNA(Gln) amidotransferase subunit GatA [Blastocatellia bacterium]HMZ19016.1 Asp-tRNA(Asn)/Glu-tRNA(Gln) amidotransferase subunit GatA [Blastocatellia bacterium]HNG30000.1 Asp-tRNA(Asn)/Glu-tRNA(Gln) amidotransferase subunit GatA [Blastocatellia bacterium]
MSTKLTVEEIHRLYAAGDATPSEIVRAAIEKIEADNERLNAYLTINREGALNQAATLDGAIQSAMQTQPLAGVPVAIKDNMCTEGVRTTCGSRILGNYVPQYTATVVKKLEAAGAIIVGKTNLDEFAMGSSTENSAFGTARNPVNPEYVPGGSSGGSAVAVAAGHVPVSLGSDTGGSIRQPASFCGIVGLKPTYGRVSRFGLVAFASSLDQIGPFAANVRDAARMLQVISGHDRHDSTSANAAVPDYLNALTGDIKGLRVGVPPECFGEGLDTEVKAAVEAAIKKLEARGAEIVEVHLPHTKYVIAVYYLIATAEASSNLARFDGVRYGYRTEEARTLSELYRRTRDEGFGAEVKRRIMLGTFALSSGYYDAYYEKAQRVRAMLAGDFAEAFKKCDVIATPTAPTPAFKIGDKSDDPLAMYLGDIYTVTLNLVGLPGISVPCGASSNGLPIGLQLIGNHFDEARLLNAAYAYEQ